tara:strand:- start:477 stop:998 length:522 start_codon:yes stop_codon:yes gene_type:complete
MKNHILYFFISSILIAPAVLAKNGFPENRMEELIASYLKIQDSLAKDDLDSAKNSTDGLKVILEEGKGGHGIKEISSFTKNIKEAKDIMSARNSFRSLSEAVMVLFDFYGSGETAVYKMYCPMAFNNQGASWLQNTKDVSNPYYGASMLKCGGLVGEKSSGCSSCASHKQPSS